ncbi:hypothetical protein GHT07_11915 [Caenimonas koreensis DSM 17982]|uniref:Phosphotransferase enzyme family protein n=1 Tax=Caenimonas koreensis DSM 17982 TaxID=1121255 RepID=A0A844B8Q7_9BURK|nr:hypothetical protein [Caenimonas koreensis]MRD47989.1 hypothetical protein [Caenimonas koreensis DSM 17982]
MTLNSRPENVVVARLCDDTIEAIRAATTAQVAKGGFSLHMGEALRATEKSQVFSAQDDKAKPLIVKRHSQRRGFASELLAYRLLEGSIHIPRVHYIDESAQVMVLSKYDPCAFNDSGSRYRVFQALGRVHGRASARVRESRLSHLACREITLGEAHRWWRSTPELAQYYQHLAQSARLASEHVALGDLGPGHILDSGQRIRFCDLETFAMGQPSELDLIALLQLPSRNDDAEQMTKAYFDARQEVCAPSRSFQEFLASLERLSYLIAPQVNLK